MTYWNSRKVLVVPADALQGGTLEDGVLIVWAKNSPQCLVLFRLVSARILKELVNFNVSKPTFMNPAIFENELVAGLIFYNKNTSAPPLNAGSSEQGLNYFVGIICELENEGVAWCNQDVVIIAKP